MSSRYDLSEQEFEQAFEAFKRAVAAASGQTGLANICRCTQGNISQLLANKSLLPERFVLKVEAATGISREELRPDIYPPASHPTAYLAVRSPSVAFGTSPVLKGAHSA
ncbi:YdaS family helix-turn-helix protein [Sphingomonas sp.]|jgi:DNA-binding transcriptional regulator YdaS (Cro superfamily)|uniref:transcriptional regulator n=1 Tax=Sphingomonas sp. TaxID=28214 RepID=UPI00344ED8A7